jgi:hypothetical protein
VQVLAEAAKSPAFVPVYVVPVKVKVTPVSFVSVVDIPPLVVPFGIVP